jgi:hypothetical protein
MINFQIPIRPSMPAFSIEATLRIREPESGLRTFNVPESSDDVSVSRTVVASDTFTANAQFKVSKPFSSVALKNVPEQIQCSYDPGDLPEGGLLMMDEQGFFTHIINPPSLDQQGMPRDIVFVIDVSGSMSGGRLQNAKTSFRKLTNMLSEADMFSVHTFSEVGLQDSWGPDYGTSENRDDAKAFVNSLETIGSTDLHGAYMEGLRALKGTKSPILVIVGSTLAIVGVMILVLIIRNRKYIFDGKDVAVEVHCVTGCKLTNKDTDKVTVEVQALSQPRQWWVVVPSDTSAGQTFIASLSGTPFSVEVPTGVKPGMKVMVQEPTSESAPPRVPHTTSQMEHQRNPRRSLGMFFTVLACLLLGASLPCLIWGGMELNKRPMGQTQAVPILVVLTDGQPTSGKTTDPREIVQDVTMENRDLKARIFGLAYGADADFGTLQSISFKNWGKASRIYEGFDDADRQMEELVQGEIGGVLMDEISCGVDGSSAGSYALTKSHPILAAGSEVVTFGRPLNFAVGGRRLNGKLRVKTSGKTRGGVYEGIAEVDLSAEPMLLGSAAQGFIYEKLRDLVAMAGSEDRNASKQARDEAISLAVSHKVVWPGLTAMLADGSACVAQSGDSCASDSVGIAFQSVGHTIASTSRAFREQFGLGVVAVLLSVLILN